MKVNGRYKICQVEMFDWSLKYSYVRNEKKKCVWRLKRCTLWTLSFYFLTHFKNTLVVHVYCVKQGFTALLSLLCVTNRIKCLWCRSKSKYLHFGHWRKRTEQLSRQLQLLRKFPCSPHHMIKMLLFQLWLFLFCTHTV